MKKPDFANMTLNMSAVPITEQKWKQALKRDSGKSLGELLFPTLENIDLKPIYFPADLPGNLLFDFSAGIAPFLRGPYATMYIQKPWTVRQYAGFSTAEESNAFFKRNLAAGQMASRWLLILPPTGGMIPIIPGLPAMSAKPVWLWIRSKT